FPRDLVDLVDINDPALGAGDVEVRRLDEAEEDVLDVLADVAGLGKRSSVGDAERDIEDLGERLGKQGLAAASRTDQKNVALLQLDLVDLHPGVDTLVVVVDRDREDFLGSVLADHVLVQLVVDLLGWGKLCNRRLSPTSRSALLVNYLAAELDAFVADINGAGTRDKTANLILALPAERTVVGAPTTASSCHCPDRLLAAVESLGLPGSL